MGVQAHLPKVSQKDLDDTKKSIEEFMDQCSDLRSRARSLEQEAGSLEASPTDIELEKLLNDEQEKYDILQARSKAIQSAAVDSTPAQIDKKRKLKNKYRGEWVKRRRLCMDIINELADAMEKKPKELQKNMGIETDEGAGVTVPTAEKIMPKPGNFRRSHQR